MAETLLKEFQFFYFNLVNNQIKNKSYNWGKFQSNDLKDEEAIV